MGADNKVIWSEGMFLRPQHFQQHDRYIERLVRSRVAGITPFTYGVTELKLNRELLLSGKFAVQQCRGILPDGTPFDILADENPPVPLELGPNVRDELVYLTLPEQQPGALEIAADGHDTLSARYGTATYQAFDAIAGADTSAELAIGKLKLRYALQSSERAGYVSIGLARVREVRADKTALLDDRYLPPTLSCAALPGLAAYVTELQGLLHQRGEELAGRAAQSAGGVPEIANFLLLQIINRYEPLLRHYGGLAELHPVTFYGTLLEMAGEFATFMSRSKRPIEFLQYRHDDLETCFAMVMGELRKAFSAVVDDAALPIPVEDRPKGFKVARLPGANKRLLKEASFVLAVQANVAAEALRRDFPRAVIVGPVERIQQLVIEQTRGIAIEPMPVAPRQIPFHAGATYFELDRASDLWAKLETSAAFAFHVNDNDFPGLTMKFWAIRR